MKGNLLFPLFLSINALEEAEEVAVGGEDGGGVFTEGALVGLECFDEQIEVSGHGA